MTTVIRAVTGAAGFIGGVWLLAVVPIAQPLPYIAAGWTLVILGLSILAPSLLDLLDGRDA